MAVSSSLLSATCSCQNMICPLVLLVMGLVGGITGCVVAAVGFGTQPIDMFDYSNQGMRIAGLILIGVAILPVTISIICWIFYCSEKRTSKTSKPLPTGSVNRQIPDDQIALGSYPYPSDNNDREMLNRYPPTGSNEQLSSSNSFYSERNASNYRSSDELKNRNMFDEAEKYDKNLSPVVDNE